MLGLVRWLVWLRGAGRFLADRRTRYVLAWLLAVWTGALVLQAAWRYWEYRHRNDGCAGHTSIDFGSSYMMGRMLVLGEGQYLYDRNHLRNVLREAYPREDEDPSNRDEPGDAESLMSWIMGSDDAKAAKTCGSCLVPLTAPDGPSAALVLAAGQRQLWTETKLKEAAAHRVGGPLYPPINALVAAPLGLFRPLTAYHLRQFADLGLALLAALGIAVLSSGRIWAPVALTVLLLYPGYFGNLHLAQTSCLALAMLVWGWALIARGRSGWGGAVWGLLAFKPVWAISFFVVLLLGRRWRAAAAMVGAAAAMVLATLPFVGVHSWFDWLKVGHTASFWYNVDSNWIHLSRDLLGIPRRYLLDFEAPYWERDRVAAAVIGWALLLSAAALTIAVALWRWRETRAVTGPRAAFLLLGGWMCCFHFMYYDVLLSYLPLACLLANSRLYLRPRLWLRQALQWQRRVFPARRRPVSARPATGALAIFPLPADPPRGPRQLAVLRLPSSSPFGWMCNPFPVLALATLLFIEAPLKASGYYDLTEPLDTYCLIVIWAWCGVVWLGRRRAATPTLAVAAQEEEDVRPADFVRVSADGAAVTPAPAP